VFGPPPVSGQHTVEIMRWLGFDDQAIDDYSARGIVAVG
jgi:crotonobetainyl-CoA:carnitine CoA-transferase CaiB-like acyl-CoA transferase